MRSMLLCSCLITVALVLLPGPLWEILKAIARLLRT